MIRTQKEIQSALVQGTIDQSAGVTWFGKGGVVFSILRALSGLIAEAYNDIVQIKRNMFIDLASGADLDTIGARRGLVRKVSSKSSAILIFTGTVNTLVPAGTQVKSTFNNTVYVTQADLIIGSKNLDYAGEASDPSLADSVIAETLITGSTSATPIHTLTVLVSPIVGVTGVDNPAPSSGGDDTEPDAVYRERLKGIVTLLNQGTQIFYESLAVSANSDVLRAIALRATGRRESLYLVKNSGGTFTSLERDAIKSFVELNHRALHPVTVLNLIFTDVQVEAGIHLQLGATLVDVHRRISDKIATYIDWRIWSPSDPVLYKTILGIIKDDVGVHDVDVDTYKLNATVGDVVMDETQLPRFTSLSITDLDNPLTPKIVTISQRYLSLPS